MLALTGGLKLGLHPQLLQSLRVATTTTAVGTTGAGSLMSWWGPGGAPVAVAGTGEARHVLLGCAQQRNASAWPRLGGAPLEEQLPALAAELADAFTTALRKDRAASEIMLAFPVRLHL